MLEGRNVSTEFLGLLSSLNQSAGGNIFSPDNPYAMGSIMGFGSSGNMFGGGNLDGGHLGNQGFGRDESGDIMALLGGGGGRVSQSSPHQKMPMRTKNLTGRGHGSGGAWGLFHLM